MAIYDCPCGLIISTSSERPRCLRCLRVLGPRERVEGRSASESQLALRDEFSPAAGRRFMDFQPIGQRTTHLRWSWVRLMLAAVGDRIADSPPNAVERPPA